MLIRCGHTHKPHPFMSEHMYMYMYNDILSIVLHNNLVKLTVNVYAN